MRDERREGMKELPSWLHKKNFNVIETQGVVKGGFRCPCDNQKFRPEDLYCVICESEANSVPNSAYLYCTGRE